MISRSGKFRADYSTASDPFPGFPGAVYPQVSRFFPDKKKVQEGSRVDVDIRFRCAASARQILGTAVLIVVGVPGMESRVQAGEGQGLPADLTQLSLEELMNIQVTSVSKKSEPLSRAAAAIFVITQEDIRRSGAQSLPEVLRLAPGIEVARVDAHSWAITSRGFNDRFANKLLVLVDGRTVYTPLFSGVFWEAQDLMMEDIERIEVIRGPGATLWGANAVNGVINIITRSARDSQGILLTAGAGTEEPGFGAVRYGTRLADDVYLRAHGRYRTHDGSLRLDGRPAEDDWRAAGGGFRLEWGPTADRGLTVQGDFYRDRFHQRYTLTSFLPPHSWEVPGINQVEGENFLVRWGHLLPDASRLQLQFYWDRSRNESVIFNERRSTMDFDLQHQIRLTESQELVWGFGYRTSGDRIAPTSTIQLDPDRRRTHLFSAFAQNEVELVADRLQLMVGSKFEHNDFTGFEIQPGLRLAWTPKPEQTFWGSVSRAVRTSSRAEHDVRINGAILPPGTVHPLLPAQVAMVRQPGVRLRDPDGLRVRLPGPTGQPHFPGPGGLLQRIRSSSLFPKGGPLSRVFPFSSPSGASYCGRERIGGGDIRHRGFRPLASHLLVAVAVQLFRPAGAAPLPVHPRPGFAG